MTQMIKVTFYQRVWRWLLGLFATRWRTMTPLELQQRERIYQLENELSRVQKQRDGYMMDNESKQAEIGILRKEIEGMAKIITRHETHWDAETAIEAQRIAAATRGLATKREDFD